MTRLLAALVGLLGLLGLLAPAPVQAEVSTGPTVVSLTFDGTFRSQVVAARVLAANGLAGTFYINSGYLGYPAYLEVEQLREIARNRNEIGGASLYGNNLSTLPAAQVRAEVCDDRATLAQLGFQVTSFAYPYGAAPASVTSAVEECGYNNARDFSGLRRALHGCSACPLAESVPPKDDYRVRTATGQGLALLKREVLNAEVSGGGWVPLVFTQICVCPEEKEGAITPSDLAAFARWLQARPATTVVRTVDQVMSGPLRPVQGTPLDRLVPKPSAAISRPQALSKVPAWSVFGYGVGQSQIIFVGVLVSLTAVVTFRIATRRQRYGQ